MTRADLHMKDLYRIGAVSRLTGIPADTLRIWERRYEIVEPKRTEKGGRLYSQEDVTKLTIIKTLVDQGHAISTVANLSIEDLHNRLSHSTNHKTAEISTTSQSIIVVGEALSVRATSSHLPDNLHIDATYSNLEDFASNPRKTDILIVELPFLDKNTTRLLGSPQLSTNCGKLVLIYAFSPSNILQQLKRLQIEVLRAPVTMDQVWKICRFTETKTPFWEPTEFHPDNISDEAIPARMFTSQQLADLSQMSSTLKCECPNHMSAIIETLIAFEQYSQNCEVDTRQDAALHSYLHVMTAKSRWMMEVALKKLAEVEDIDLNNIPKARL